MSEQEIKPAISEWKIRDVYFDEEGEPAAHRALPDTHRIVSVELLEEIADDLDVCLGRADLSEQLRTIIDKTLPSPTVTASDVKALREATGYGLIACKNALVRAKGNATVARKLLARGG
jgi:hypothetical protein